MFIEGKTAHPALPTSFFVKIELVASAKVQMLCCAPMQFFHISNDVDSAKWMSTWRIGFQSETVSSVVFLFLCSTVHPLPFVSIWLGKCNRPRSVVRRLNARPIGWKVSANATNGDGRNQPTESTMPDDEANCRRKRKKGEKTNRNAFIIFCPFSLVACFIYFIFRSKYLRIHFLIVRACN